MNNNIFATDIEAVLENGTEVKNVSGYIVNNKRVFKLEDNTILTGSKKIKTIKSSTILVSVQILSYIANLEYE